MSRRNRKRNQEQEKPKDSSRRKFVVGGIAAALGALAAPAVYVLNHRPSNDDRWSFLHRKIDLTIPGDAWRYPAAYYAPLCSEREFEKQEKKLEELIRLKMPAIRNEARTRGFNGENGLLGTEQYFGRPEEPRFAESYKEYLNLSIDYLYSRLTQLKKVPLEIIVLKQGDNYSKNWKGKGFIGYSLHNVQRVYVTNRQAGKKFTVGLSENIEGAFTRPRYENNEIVSYFVFFGTGPMALGAAFSELIPLATSKADAPHHEKFGEEKNQIAAEAFSEGISYLLALDIVKELDIPNGAETANQIQECMKKVPRYHLVPASIRWLKENGIEKGLDLYMSGPEKFVKAIEG